jgi:hypothetical protein
VIGHDPDELDPDLRYDPGPAFRSEARRRLRWAELWTVILVFSLPLSLLAVLQLCHLLAKAGVHPYLTWAAFVLGGVGSIAVSVQIATHQPFDTMGLSDWMSGRGSEFAFEFAVIAATVSALASFFSKTVAPALEKIAFPIAANVFQISLFIWATLVAYRLKPLLDGYADMRKRKRRCR